MPDAPKPQPKPEEPEPPGDPGEEDHLPVRRARADRAGQPVETQMVEIPERR